MGVVGIMEVKLISAKGLKRTNFLDKIDPYVVIQYINEEHTSSTAQGQGRRSVWNEEFKFRVEYPTSPHKEQQLLLQMYDRDSYSSDNCLGKTTIYLKEVIELGMEKGKVEVGIQKYRVVLEDKTYHGEIQVGITFTAKGVNNQNNQSDGDLFY